MGLTHSYTTRKLKPKIVGPLPVLARVGASRYRLQLPKRLRRSHPVFHVSVRRPHHRAAPLDQVPAFVDSEGVPEYEVETILAHRQNSRRG